MVNPVGSSVFAQTQVDWTAFLSIIEQGGLIVVFGFALYAGSRGWYIWRPSHNREIALLEGERDRVLREAAESRQAFIIELQAVRETHVNELIAVRAARDRQEASLTADRNYWRDNAVSALKVTEAAIRGGPPQ